MKETNIIPDTENLFRKNLDNLVSQYKNELIIKTINLYLSSNYREAEVVLLTQFPENSFNDDSTVQYLMGHIKLKLEEYESALNYFCHALNTEASQVPLIYDSRGLTCILQHDYDRAIQNFKEACSYSQNNFHFHNHLAICYQIIFSLQQEKEEKILNLSKSKISESDNGSKSLNSSNLDSSENEKEKERIIERQNRRIRRKTENNQKIINKIKEAFQDAININPNSYISLVNLGTYYANEGQIEQAEKYYKRAESINKQSDQNDYKIYDFQTYLLN